MSDGCRDDQTLSTVKPLIICVMDAPNYFSFSFFGIKKVLYWLLYTTG